VQAERLHPDLGIDTFEDLEAAADDGRLASLAGFGAKRIAGISKSGRFAAVYCINRRKDISSSFAFDRDRPFRAY
jgi:DNA polymerase/3'-5' exonuclease PolX